MKNASTQVEMDEFLVLRRLNLEIQGFPESYISDPDELADMCGAEPHPPPPVAVGMPQHHGPPSGLPPQQHLETSSMQMSMAVGADDPTSADLADDAAGSPSVASGTDSK